MTNPKTQDEIKEAALKLVKRLRGFQPSEEGNDSAADMIDALIQAKEAAERRAGELEKGLAVFARIADVGKRGGRFVIAHAVYEDMARSRVSAPRESYWHWSDFERARSLLTGGKS